MNGAPGLLYMESVAQADGSGSINWSFRPRTNAKLAQVNVQNRLARATPRLFSAVKQQGVHVDKSRSNFLLSAILSSTNPAYDPIALGDYAARNVLPELQRMTGVGTAQLFGPEPCHARLDRSGQDAKSGLSSDAVIAAIRAQNAQVTSGTLDDLPNIAGQGISATVVVTGQLSNVEQFGQVVLRANADGSTVRLKDVARLELGGQSYAIRHA